MQVLINFSAQELNQLYLTFKRNPSNYTKIKEMILGVNSEEKFARNKKSLRFFFITVTFIIAVSSSFSLMADHMNSFISLWLIWTGAFILFIAANIIINKNTTYVQEKNKAFFEAFEFTANKNTSLDAFQSEWYHEERS